MERKKYEAMQARNSQTGNGQEVAALHQKTMKLIILVVKASEAME